MGNFVPFLHTDVSAGLVAKSKMVCTQPRRLAAISVAQRVANERVESIGDVVGYAVRLESRQSERTRLTFCTTGVLLKQLQSDPLLSQYSHIFIDEVIQLCVCVVWMPVS